LRQTGLEPGDVEVKTAAGGLPQSVPETLSAFANGAGGTLILGLSEADEFRPVAGFDAERVRESLAQACHEKMSPPVRGPIEVEDFEGARVIRLDVDELDPLDKPCFVTSRGEYNGSFIRGGDGDRRLTRYEVTQLLSNRSQPTFDLEVVADATLDDLDSKLVDATIAHATERTPRAFGGNVERATALARLGAARKQAGTSRPTLAGLLSLGTYPQQFFPQLFVSFVALPAVRMGEVGPDGERFLDNVTVDGPIPVVLAETVTALRRNMNRAAIIRGLGREDRYDYPLETIRELIVNALMHRDYSPESRGTQIQIELYPDRLVVRSAGGLFGDVTVDALGASTVMSTSRNAALAKLLADVPLEDRPTETIVENRGSGLLRAVESLRRAGMSPPEFDAQPGRLEVIIPRTALLSPETIEWIGSLGLPHLSDEQHLALAMMRNAGRVNTATLRTWGVEASAAGRALRELVDRGIALRSGGKRYATYHLTGHAASPATPPLASATSGGLSRTAPAPQPLTRPDVEADLDPIVGAIEAGEVTARGISEHLDIGYQTVLRRLRLLIERGVITPTRPTQSRKQSYQLTNREEK
jgi:ATP-dependent DNA helicase RecG